MVPVEKETDPLKIATKELVAGKVLAYLLLSSPPLQAT